MFRDFPGRRTGSTPQPPAILNGWMSAAQRSGIATHCIPWSISPPTAAGSAHRRARWSRAVLGRDTASRSRTLWEHREIIVLVRSQSPVTLVSAAHLSTAWQVENSRGEFFTRDVKINSKRELNLARTHSACVVPRSLDLAFRILRVRTVLKPTPAIERKGREIRPRSGITLI